MLVLEKPFGSDEASAHALNETLASLVPERQVFRVDHFLGRSTTLNLLGVRFANRVVEPVWSAEHIESVAIVYDESLALEGRAGYYDKAGAFVDMIQSHLLQVLAVLAMEQPATLDEVDFRAATSAVLRATEVWDDDPVHSSRRARYTAGEIGARRVPSYVDEPGVDPARHTETLAQATFEVRNSRWTGVPFTLQSGKALGNPATEIVARFRPVRHLPTGLTGDSAGAVLRFSLGPDTMSLELNVNGGEDPFVLERATLTARARSGRAQGLRGGAVQHPRRRPGARGARRCRGAVLAHRRSPSSTRGAAATLPLEDYVAGSDGPTDWPVLR